MKLTAKYKNQDSAQSSLEIRLRNAFGDISFSQPITGLKDGDEVNVIVGQAEHEAFEAKFSQFRTASLEFLQKQFGLVLDATDAKTSDNYWAVLVLMAETMVAQLNSSRESGLLKFEPMPGDTDYEDWLKRTKERESQ